MNVLLLAIVVVSTCGVALCIWELVAQSKRRDPASHKMVNAKPVVDFDHDRSE